MKTQFSSIIASLAVAFAATSISTKVSAAGEMLVDPDGMALYTYDKDTNDKSNCYDRCAAKWPPYLAASADAKKAGYGVISRKDGTYQWTHNSKPLYTWVGDSQKGVDKGNGVGGVWRTAFK